MEMLDLLGEENTDVKKAIQKILDTEDTVVGNKDTRQGFVCLEGEKEIPKIAYSSQKDHAINWLYSKALWEKSNSALDLQKVIKNLQCPTLIFYLAALTDLVEVNTIEELIGDIEIKEQEVTRKNIRFIEKKLLIDKLGKDWFENIAAGLIS
ncbi:hypothetical protein [Enterococcus cecorum]|uniref:Uncharacterized protein n=1 Tax=Enterococcus cecorum TaxID=44008 RepID=A0A200HS39_9ENTE|nr:hypothetical protein [Enterococcus cecorum]OUZ14875.1 hypothetical protein A5869_001981 [Enterococcus cecorum]